MMHWLHLCSGGDSVVQEPQRVYLELCKYWSSPEFKAKFEKKRINHAKDLKHRYDAGGHIRKLQRMIKFVVQVLYI
jgi:hypothetical protein